MRVMGRGEVIRVGEVALAGLPQLFTWRGCRHVIWRIEGVSQGPGEGRKTYRVCTASGMHCALSVDIRTGLWRMERVLPGHGGRNGRGNAVVRSQWVRGPGDED